MRFPKRQLERLDPARILVQQVAQVRGRPVCARDCQQHTYSSYVSLLEPRP